MHNPESLTMVVVEALQLVAFIRAWLAFSLVKKNDAFPEENCSV